MGEGTVMSDDATPGLITRHRHTIKQFVKFAIVGAGGVVVNQAVLIAANKSGRGLFGLLPQQAAFPLVAGFNVRWYHVYIALGFLVANLFNFQLNRTWTFRSGKHARWASEYFPFLGTGMFALALGLVISTLLMHPGSPIALPDSVFNDSSGLRNKLYWANLIQIAIVTPVNYVINKVWTFRAVRHHNPSVPVPDPSEEHLRDFVHPFADEQDRRSGS